MSDDQNKTETGSASKPTAAEEEPVELFQGDRKVENIVSFEESENGGRAARINVSEFYKYITEYASEREAQEKKQAESKQKETDQPKDGQGSSSSKTDEK